MCIYLLIAMPKDNDAHVSLIMCELTAIFLDWQHMLNGPLGSHSLKHKQGIICRFINMFLSLSGSQFILGMRFLMLTWGILWGIYCICQL